MLRSTYTSSRSHVQNRLVLVLWSRKSSTLCFHRAATYQILFHRYLFIAVLLYVVGTPFGMKHVFFWAWSSDDFMSMSYGVKQVMNTRKFVAVLPKVGGFAERSNCYSTNSCPMKTKSPRIFASFITSSSLINLLCPPLKCNEEQDPAVAYRNVLGLPVPSRMHRGDSPFLTKSRRTPSGPLWVTPSTAVFHQCWQKGTEIHRSDLSLAPMYSRKAKLLYWFESVPHTCRSHRSLRIPLLVLASEQQEITRHPACFCRAGHHPDWL